MPFFETLNPGFKIYIGDFLLFDYFLDAHRGGRFDTVSSSIINEAFLITLSGLFSAALSLGLA